MAREKPDENGREIEKDGIKYLIRRATKKDIPKIMAFVDIHLRADWLVRRPYLNDNLNRGYVYLIEHENKLIAWAICSHDGRLWNLLVRPDHRGKGLGGEFIKALNPTIIRSKSDQSTGDPTDFYQKLGYEILEKKVGRKKNINIMKKAKVEVEHAKDE
jgi:N-acetylglutamate synthase-like GNAT family acetyltransferase